MSYFEEEPVSPVRPLEMLDKNLNFLIGEIDEDTTFSMQELLKALRLDGDESDGKSLVERLIPETESPSLLETRRESPDEYQTLMIFVGKINEVFNMLEHGHQFSGEQERVISDLAEVFARQLIREEQICGVAASNLLRIAHYRPEYITEDIQGRLKEMMFTDGEEMGIPEELFMALIGGLQDERMGSILRTSITFEGVHLLTIPEEIISGLRQLEDLRNQMFSHRNSVVRNMEKLEGIRAKEIMALRMSMAVFLCSGLGTMISPDLIPRVTLALSYLLASYSIGGIESTANQMKLGEELLERIREGIESLHTPSQQEND